MRRPGAAKINLRESSLDGEAQDHLGVTGPASAPRAKAPRSASRLDSISWRVLALAAEDLDRGEFLARVASVIAEHSGFSKVDVCLGEGPSCDRGRSHLGLSEAGCLPVCSECHALKDDQPLPVNSLCLAMLADRVPTEARLSGGGGPLVVRGPVAKVPLMVTGQGPRRVQGQFELGAGIKTALVVPFSPQSGAGGLLVLRSEKKKRLSRLAIEFYENVAQLVGVAIARRATQRAEQARMRELQSLYRLAELLAEPALRVDDIIELAPRLVAEGCPPFGAARARVSVDGQEAAWPDAARSEAASRSPIVVQGVERGWVEVAVVGAGSEADPEDGKRAARFVDAVAHAIATALHRWDLQAEQCRLQLEVQHAERLATVGTLVAGLAHEVNEPLAAILGFAELVGKDPALSGDAQRDLGKIIKATRHVHSVVKRLLMFSRASMPNLRSASLNEAVEDALSFVEPSCVRAGVRVVRRLQPDLPTLVADPEQLCQVVVNLAINAVHAMPNGGELVVETDCSGSQLSLVVRDTGLGMNDDVRQKVFEPFFTTKDRDRGLGLGLAVVKGIANAHGGRVVVQSAPGQGTTMTIELPLNPPSVATPAARGDSGG